MGSKLSGYSSNGANCEGEMVRSPGCIPEQVQVHYFSQTYSRNKSIFEEKSGSPWGSLKNISESFLANGFVGAAWSRPMGSEPYIA